MVGINLARETRTVSINPKEMAALFWEMGSDDQAEFFEELQHLGGDSGLIGQGLYIRDSCGERSLESLAGFQNLSSCAFKWMTRYSDNSGFS